MYIYFDKQGVVKEIIQVDKVRLGSAESNKFYIYFEEDNNIGVDILIERPDGTKTTEIPINLNVETKEIPYNKNQDLKFFQDYKPYKFYTYTLTSDDIQGQKGLFLATIRAFQDAHNVILAEGLITFNVENNVIKEDHYITQSQYDHLMSLIARYINLNMVVDITYSNYSMVVSYRDKTSKTFDFSQIRINKENIESLTQRVTANENKLVQHENKLTEHTQKLNQHDTSIQALEVRASGIEEVNRQQQVELDQHQGLITLIQQDIATIQGRLDVVENNVNINNALLNDHETRLDNIENSKGQPNGIATLDGDGKIPSNQLPSYVDEILEFDNKSLFPSVGESGKIYIANDTNLQYRWSGSTYVEISTSLALGETSSTAYPGDKGKQNRNSIDTLLRFSVRKTDFATYEKAGIVRLSRDFYYKHSGEISVKKPVEIVRFSAEPSKQKNPLGTELYEIRFEWKIKNIDNIVNLRIEDTDISALEWERGFYVLKNLNINKTTTFTLTVTDSYNNLIKKTCQVEFVNFIYWGFNSNNYVDNLNLLPRRFLKEDIQGFYRSRTTANDQTFYFAIPVRFGTPKLLVNGVQGGFNSTIQQHTNTFGYTEDYIIFSTNQVGFKEIILEVEKYGNIFN